MIPRAWPNNNAAILSRITRVKAKDQRSSQLAAIGICRVICPGLSEQLASFSERTIDDCAAAVRTCRVGLMRGSGPRRSALHGFTDTHKPEGKAMSVVADQRVSAAQGSYGASSQRMRDCGVQAVDERPEAIPRRQDCRVAGCRVHWPAGPCTGSYPLPAIRRRSRDAPAVLEAQAATEHRNARPRRRWWA